MAMLKVQNKKIIDEIAGRTYKANKKTKFSYRFRYSFDYVFDYDYPGSRYELLEHHIRASDSDARNGL